jgi:hypothetical protein
MNQRVTFRVLLAAAVLWPAPTLAKPVAPSVFCTSYPSSPVCAGGAPACTFCHTTPPARNTFGVEVAAALLPEAARPLSDEMFAAALPDALTAVETRDSDQDGFTNADEILAGAYPADKNSTPAAAGCPTSSEANGGYDVCNYDQRYVYKKLHLDFCGETVAYDRLLAFDVLEDKWTELHAALDRCLDSEAWIGKDGALYRIAHRKIKPVQSIKSGEDAGDIPLGDYFDDYKLFVYTQIDNHDAREVLTARYFVETENGAYVTVMRAPLEDVQRRGPQVAQLVGEDRRAGMLTTRWNFVLNTMFTAIPRTTAAQAYRSYLGLDIARSEGLDDVPGEPRDYDQKGVQAAECSRCHATLDPLSYPFTRYAGFTGGDIPFSYAPARMRNLSNGPNDPLRDTPEAGVIFDTQVANLQEWANVAANSEAFATATVLDYWLFLMGEPPRPTEQVELEQLWLSFMTEHNYGVERMLHDLIDTEAYGVP